MKKGFEIICKELTRDRKTILAAKEVIAFSKPLRAVIAVGGAWIFYYGTSGDEPESVQYMAVVFAAVGIAAILIAIFMQKIREDGYFSKAAKEGCFPASVAVGEGGVFVRRGSGKKPKETLGVTSVNAERFFAFAEVGRLEDYEYYFKLNFTGGDIPAIFLFKEDFGEKTPEAFKTFIASKKAAL